MNDIDERQTVCGINSYANLIQSNNWTQINKLCVYKSPK